MAIAGSIGTLNIEVRARTDKVRTDIEKAFYRAMDVAQYAGQEMQKKLSEGMSGGNNRYKALDDAVASMRKLYPEAEKARAGFMKLSASGYAVQGAVGALAGSVSSLVGGLGAMIGVVGAAAPAVVALASSFAALKVGMAVGKLAFSGIAQALSGLNRAGRSGKKDQIELAKENLAQVLQRNKEALVRADREVKDSQKSLTKTLKDAREEYQQLGFSAEQAALDEEGAGIALERAREELARTQDLAPNDRVRREAELAYKNAELHLREAKDKTADLNTEQQRLAKNGIEDMDSVIQARRNATDAIDNQTKAIREAMLAQRKAEQEVIRSRKGAAGSDPLKGLSKSQKEFVLYLQSLRPLMMDLKEAAAGGFLPVLREQMDALINGGMFTKLTAGIAEVSLGLGQATKNFTSELLNPTTMDNFSSFMSESAKLLPVFGSMLGDVFGGVLGILKAAQPLTDKFMAFLHSKTMNFKDMIDTKGANGQLEAFFNRAGTIAAQFGHVFGNVFAGLGSMIKANFGPVSGGQLLLNWLDNSTAKFRNLNDAASQNKMQTYFLMAAKNTHEMMSTLGAVLATFKDLGSDPSVAIFWSTLKQGVPAIKQILVESEKTAPAMAQLLVSVTKLLASFADSGAAIVFFKMLTQVSDIFVAISDALKPVLDFLGRLHGAFVAIYVTMGLLNKVKSIYIGLLIKSGVGLSKLVGQSKIMTTAQQNLSTATTRLSESTIRVTEAEIAYTKASIDYERINASKLATDEARALALKQVEVAEMRAEAATIAHTEAIAAEQLAAKKANSIGTKVGAFASKAGGYAMAAAIVIDIAAQLSAEFDRIRQESYKTEKDLTADMIAGARATQILSDAVAGIDLNSLNDNPWGVKINQNGKIAANGISTITKSIKELNVYQKQTKWDQGWRYLGDRANVAKMDDLAVQLGKVGSALSTIAASDLPKAQAQFKGMMPVFGDNATALATLKAQFPDYVDQLRQAAAGAGVLLNDHNLLSMATGGATSKTVEMITKTKEMTSTAMIAASEIINYGDAFKKATDKGKFSLTEFQKALDQQIKDAQEKAKNLLILQVKGATADTIAAVTEGGPSAIAAFAKMTTGEISKWNTKFAEKGRLAGDALTTALQPNIPVLQRIGATYGDTIMNKVAERLIKGQSIQEAIKGLNISDVVFKVKPKLDTTDWNVENERWLAQLEKERRDRGLFSFSKPTVFHSLGGIIPKFAAGGSPRVFGPGGSKADRVPAMLSPGEYVINARATREAYQTIQAINSGRLTDRSIVGGSKGKVHTVHEKAAPNILITVNPSAGMNEQDLAAIVSRQIGFQFSKGTM